MTRGARRWPRLARDAIERAQEINEQAAARRASSPDGPAPVATELTVLHFERH